MSNLVSKLPSVDIPSESTTADARFVYFHADWLEAQIHTNTFCLQVAPSPATGSKAQHNKELRNFINDAMSI